MKVNPSTLLRDIGAEKPRMIGVNRVSYGVQGIYDTLLKQNGRHHTENRPLKPSIEAISLEYLNTTTPLFVLTIYKILS